MTVKKLIALLLGAAMILALAACGNAEGSNTEASAESSSEETEATESAETASENTQIANPCTEVTVEEAAEGLNFDELTFAENVTVNSATKINGSPVIYSFDLTKDGIDYTFRLALDDGSTTEISGVYLSEDAQSSEYCSADADTFPSVSAAADSSYAVATGTWKGYIFSVAAEGLSCEEIYAACSELVGCLPLRQSM